MLILGASLEPNVLRAGDVALCCPEPSGRQGYGACTLLWAGLFSYHLEILFFTVAYTQ